MQACIFLVNYIHSRCFWNDSLHLMLWKYDHVEYVQVYCSYQVLRFRECYYSPLLVITPTKVYIYYNAKVILFKFLAVRF